MLLQFKMCARFRVKWPLDIAFTGIAKQSQIMEASNEAKMYLYLPTLILVFNLSCGSGIFPCAKPPPPPNALDSLLH